MGCTSSKRVEAAALALDVYRPPPTSIALFDINSIEEPWMIATAGTDPEKEVQEKKAAVAAVLPLPLLEKLDSYELGPKSWSDVSKALEDLKPSFEKPPMKAVSLPPLQTTVNATAQAPPAAAHPSPKSKSFHTLQELEVQTSSPSKEKPVLPPKVPAESGVYRPVQDNSFLQRDRMERENKKNGGGAPPKWKKRDPFEGFQELSPPGNSQGIVLYTTTLRGVRRTFEDCELARRVVEQHATDAGLDVDERDVSLHSGYLKELREIAGEAAVVPRLFVAGRYIGGTEEVVELGDAGKLREMFRLVARRGGASTAEGGRRGCEYCGGARFVPCLECSGSCKVLADDGKAVVRCVFDTCDINAASGGCDCYSIASYASWPTRALMAGTE